jgi:hypothetical protein
MFTFIVWGLLAAIILVFYSLRLWTGKKQCNLSAQEFQASFQHSYFGMNRPTEVAFPSEPPRDVAGQMLRDYSGTRS